MREFVPRLKLLQVTWGTIGSVRANAIRNSPDAETLHEIGNRMFLESVALMEKAAIWQETGEKPEK